MCSAPDALTQAPSVPRLVPVLHTTDPTASAASLLFLPQHGRRTRHDARSALSRSVWPRRRPLALAPSQRLAPARRHAGARYVEGTKLRDNSPPFPALDAAQSWAGPLPRTSASPSRADTVPEMSQEAFSVPRPLCPHVWVRMTVSSSAPLGRPRGPLLSPECSPECSYNLSPARGLVDGHQRALCSVTDGCGRGRCWGGGEAVCRGLPV